MMLAAVFSAFPFNLVSHPDEPLSMKFMPRSLSAYSVLLITFLSSAGLPVRPASAADRPNVIFLMADDQAVYSMGCYGTPGAKTDHLDRLAHDGMVFDNHYDTTAICMASRANVMTGKFEYKTGCNFDHGAMTRSIWQQSYPMLMRDAGYRTAFAGKFGFEVSEQPGRKGVLPDQDFDLWGGGPGQTSYDTEKNVSMKKYAADYPHSTRSYGAFGRDFVAESAAGDAPFCLSISFKAPHHPVQPDPVDADVYKGYVFTKPGNYGRDAGSHFSLQSRQGRQFERFNSWNYATKYDQTMALYYQQIYAIDVAVGMIRQAVIDAGVADNTVIIYTSDNGFMCGSHGYGSKVLPYEESSRVPLIIFDPRRPNTGKHLRCDALTGNVDFLPTILDLAKIAVPDDVDGKSLLGLYDDPSTDGHDSLPLINVWGPKKVHSLAVVTRDWKYIRWPYAEDDFEVTEELYNTAADPMELDELSGQVASSADLKRMRAVYDTHVDKWDADAVDYNNYRSFIPLFRR